MTRGFALIAENPLADVWVMDPAVECAEQTTNLPDSALVRVRSIEGGLSAVPLAFATSEARSPNARFQPFQGICADDATTIGVPALKYAASPTGLHAPYSAIADPGGSNGTLQT